MDAASVELADGMVPHGLVSLEELPNTTAKMMPMTMIPITVTAMIILVVDDIPVVEACAGPDGAAGAAETGDCPLSCDIILYRDQRKNLSLLNQDRRHQQMFV